MTRARTNEARERRRGFLATVSQTDGTTYGLAIAETNGQPDHTQTIVTIRPAEMARLSETIQAALRASKRPPTTIGPTRRQPVEIDEAPGVRLALTALALEPLRRRDRVREVIDGVASMSDEESYYWYAKVTHPDSGSRALRALRLLLSDDER